MPDLTANSALSANNPGTPMDYNTWFQQTYGSGNNWDIDPGYGLGGKLRNWMTGGADKARDQYNAYLVTNQRAYDEWLSSTSYRRAAADLKAAGLNPYLALTGAFSGGSTPDSGSLSSVQQKKNNNELGPLGALVSTALMVVATIATKGMAAKAGAANAGKKVINNFFYRH